MGIIQGDIKEDGSPVEGCPHDAQVVEGEDPVVFGDNLLNRIEDGFVVGVVAVDGIHVDHHHAAGDTAHGLLHIFGDFVNGKGGEVVRHFDMKGNNAVFPVVVHHNVVDAEDIGDGAAGPFDFVKEGLGGRFADEGADSLPCDGPGRGKDGQGDPDAHDAVHLKVAETGGDEGDDDEEGGEGVGSVVKGVGLEGVGVDVISQDKGEPCHELFGEGRGEDDGNGAVAGDAHGGCHDGGDALFQELETRHEEEDGDDEGGHRLDAAVAEGVFAVRGFSGHFKAHDHHGGGGGVREGMDGVGDEGGAAHGEADDEFHGKQKGVADDAHPAFKGAVIGAYVGV